METISIKNKNGKEYKFEKPEFECELLKTVRETKNRASGVLIIGWVYDKDDEAHSVMWNLDNGKAYIYNQWIDDYNLTPIKPKWYEDEAMIGKIISIDYFDTTQLAIFIRQKDEWIACASFNGAVLEQKAHKCRPATEEEVLSLFYQGKEK